MKRQVSYVTYGCSTKPWSTGRGFVFGTAKGRFALLQVEGSNPPNPQLRALDGASASTGAGVSVTSALPFLFSGTWCDNPVRFKLRWHLRETTNGLDYPVGREQLISR